MWGQGEANVCVISLIGYRCRIRRSYIRNAAHLPGLHIYMPELLWSILFSYLLRHHHLEAACTSVAQHRSTHTWILHIILH